MANLSYASDVFSAEVPEHVPAVYLDTFDEDIFTSYTGPDDGLCIAKPTEDVPVAGVHNWKCKDQKAYGICISLYDQHPVNGKMSGDPIADAFAVCARKNNAVLIIADGVNWGEKSRLAARCALYGCMTYINDQIFTLDQQPNTTQEALQILRSSIDIAHQTILEKTGGLTTVCVCLICPVFRSDRYAVCCVNVGDSYAFVLSRRFGIREVTIGSHDVSEERDIRDAQGALGPVDGQNPELRNLTCSLTFCSPEDIVFLTTDGISDNFDPVISKVALPFLDCSPTHQSLGRSVSCPSERHNCEMCRKNVDLTSEQTSDKFNTGKYDNVDDECYKTAPMMINQDSDCYKNDTNVSQEQSDNQYSQVLTENSVPTTTCNHVCSHEDKAKIIYNRPRPSMKSDKPEMRPNERHVYAMKDMERVIHDFELITEEWVSAQELCSALVQHVLQLTDQKRKVLENPSLYVRKRLSKTDRKRRDSEIVERMSKAPGKLDHASIVAVEVGVWCSVKETVVEDSSSMTLVDSKCESCDKNSKSLTAKRRGKKLSIFSFKSKTSTNLTPIKSEQKLNPAPSPKIQHRASDVSDSKSQPVSPTSPFLSNAEPVHRRRRIIKSIIEKHRRSLSYESSV